MSLHHDVALFSHIHKINHHPPNPFDAAHSVFRIHLFPIFYGSVIEAFFGVIWCTTNRKEDDGLCQIQKILRFCAEMYSKVVGTRRQ